MAEPDSWEDEPPATQPPSLSSFQPMSTLNANAPSFTFNPSVPAFNPTARAFTPSYISPQTVGSEGQSPAPVEASPSVSTQPEAIKDIKTLTPSAEAGNSSAGDSGTEDVAVQDGYEDVKEHGADDGSSKDLTDQVATILDSLKVGEVPAHHEVHLHEEEEELEEKQHLNVVFIGHVDAGKSTIGGQILYLTDMVDERTIQKYEKEAKDKNRESWYMAYIMDTNEEERAKGITVEVGRAHFETAERRFTILDAPGHKNFVPNMISGASQADVGVLVISARKGEFETGFERGGQTREHAQLAKTLGVSKLLVVVNKMDDPSVEWAKERFDEIEKKIVPFLRSCGYNIKKDVLFLPISGLLGYNMKERMPKTVCSWWDGPCFFEALDKIETPIRDPMAPFRWTLRSSSM